MPQMAPLNWLSLMIYFMIIFMIFNSLNYFSFFYTPKTFFIKKKNISINWKW
uniref:ATP synthase complex subunit 8 n=1 Tax=Vincenzellus ruficollis TaxID=295991 RepID=A0A343A417_9CUCU|nr:ATP synthase F0 subunit 8 [Vincenzellus ruficollis]AOY39295.1 ATP synthase F0 subunit 8 [Vincenzellus ruficollis]